MANIKMQDLNIPISDDVKNALLNCFSNVAWANSQGQTYYNALLNALYPLDHITAIYTQGGTVYSTDSLDSLKTDLVVTAYYGAGITETVAAEDYTLSGTLTAGTSTVTVSYGGKTATFTVTVTDVLWEFTNGYTCVKGNGATAGKIYRQAVAARACGHDPIPNNGYVFTVTDSTKYNLCAYDVTDLTKISITAATSVDKYAYAAGSKAIEWNTSDSVSTPYVWLALKKMDGTAFTDEELANGAAAVFTYTEGT